MLSASTFSRHLIGNVEGVKAICQMIRLGGFSLRQTLAKLERFRHVGKH